MGNRWGNSGNSYWLYFWGYKITADGDCSHESQRYLVLGRKVMTKLDSILKSRDITLPTVPSSQSYGFSSSRVWMWKVDYKESWVPNNWCFWTVKLEKTRDCKEIQAVHPKGNPSWIFIRTDPEAETPILWPPDVNDWLTGKTLMLGNMEGGRRREWQRMRRLDAVYNPMDMTLSKLQEWWWTRRPGMLQAMELQRVWLDWVTELKTYLVVLI